MNPADTPSPTVLTWRSDGDNRELIQALKRALDAGRLVAFPTDTVYGVGGRWDDPETAGRLRALKGSADGRPFQVLARGSEAFPPGFVRWSSLAGHFAEAHLRGQDPNSDGSARISTAAIQSLRCWRRDKVPTGLPRSPGRRRRCTCARRPRR